MVLCASCKNISSNDRCTSTSLAGISLCGRHAKVRSPRVWVVVNNIDLKIILISKLWRGYFVRKQLSLAGPGVLNRSVCNNTEELVSLEPISTVNIIDYFGFEEDSKIYGFDVRTMLDVLHRNIFPTNPYTRQPIKLDVRKRLRQIYTYRLRNKIENTYENNILKTHDAILINRWMQLSQIAEENGFFNIHPNLFLELNKTQLYILLKLIQNDLKTWSAEHKHIYSKRFTYVFWVNNILKKFDNANYTNEYSFYTSSIILSILYDSGDPYTICFIIMSALYRL